MPVSVPIFSATHRKTVESRAATTSGIVAPRGPGSLLTQAYRRHGVGESTLADLPEDGPEFVFYATSLETGTGVRITRAGLDDYKLGRYPFPEMPVAQATMGIIMVTRACHVNPSCSISST